MKKILFIVLVIAMVFFTACSPKAEAPKAVRVVLDPTWPPFEMIDEATKEMSGFDIDLMKAIAKEEGFEVEFINLAFDSAIAGIAQCQYDASISAITITEERSKQMKFSNPYYISGQILTVKAGNEAINTKEALSGKTVGGQTGTTGAIMAQEWANEGVTKYKGYDSVDLAFLDVKNGQLDAALTDDTVAYEYAKTLGGISPVGELFSSENYGIAVCNKNADLLKKIDSGLEKIKTNGTWDEIYKKYFEAQ